eukprot:scaffold148065_cov20-Tisochrysis_lutea.AAC.1
MSKKSPPSAVQTKLRVARRATRTKFSYFGECVASDTIDRPIPLEFFLLCECNLSAVVRSLHRQIGSNGAPPPRWGRARFTSMIEPTHYPSV